jgi:hypothetical protein
VIDQSAIEREITQGLPNEAAERDEYRRNALYLDGNFAEDLQVWMEAENGPKFPSESIRTTLVMRRVVDVLTSNLYRIGPERSIQDNEPASEWLNTLYQDRAVDTLWQEADRLSLVNHVAAFQVVVDEDPDAPSPLGIQLWGGEELFVWTDSEDPRKPVAVATLDKFDESRRLKLWTTDQVVEYRTDKIRPGQTAGGVAFKLVSREANPWGFLPFAFAHGVYPARYFKPQGPPLGSYLRWLNRHVNYRLSTGADDILHSRPIPVIEGTAGDFEFRKRRPGDWQTIPALADAGGSAITDPRASYVTCDLSFLGVDWEDLRAYLDHCLEMVNVPPVAVRMEQTSARSGVSIVAEQIPLAQWAESRTRPYTVYERRLARLVFKAGAALGLASGLEEAADAEGGITLRWPEMLVELPGPERDQHDQWMMDNGLLSRTQWLMLRERLTGDEAKNRLEVVNTERVDDAKVTAKVQQTINPNPGPQPGQPGQPPVDGDDE